MGTDQEDQDDDSSLRILPGRGANCRNNRQAPHSGAHYNLDGRTPQQGYHNHST